MGNQYSRVCSNSGLVGMAIHELLLSRLDLGGNWHVIDHQVNDAVMIVTNRRHFIVVQYILPHNVDSHVAIHVYCKYGRKYDIANKCLSDFDGGFQFVFYSFTDYFDISDFGVSGGTSACILEAVCLFVNDMIHDINVGNGVDTWHGKFRNIISAIDL